MIYSNYEIREHGSDFVEIGANDILPYLSSCRVCFPFKHTSPSDLNTYGLGKAKGKMETVNILVISPDSILLKCKDGYLFIGFQIRKCVLIYYVK